jgi:polyferredoxin
LFFAFWASNFILYSLQFILSWVVLALMSMRQHLQGYLIFWKSISQLALYIVTGEWTRVLTFWLRVKHFLSHHQFIKNFFYSRYSIQP